MAESPGAAPLPLPGGQRTRYQRRGRPFLTAAEILVFLAAYLAHLAESRSELTRVFGTLVAVAEQGLAKCEAPSVRHSIIVAPNLAQRRALSILNRHNRRLRHTALVQTCSLVSILSRRVRRRLFNPPLVQTLIS